MKFSPNKITTLLEQYIRAKIPAVVLGSPGIGKSQVVYQLAKKFNLKVIDMRLSQCDPTDLSGFPFLSPNGERAGYKPMDTFPLEGDPLPEGFDGWVLFLDEITSAPPAVQASAYKVVLDRMVGNRKLHDRVVILAAGNKETDGAITHQVSTALQSRLAWMEMEVHYKQWCDWAEDNGIHHYFTDFIRFKPECLYTFNPDTTNHTYACPRTWEYASKLWDSEASTQDMIDLLTGVISEGVAREFVQFTKIYKSLITVEQIEKNPIGIPVPYEPSVLYALSGTLSNHINATNADKLMEFILRIPPEFQVITLRNCIRKDSSLLNIQAINTWTTKFSDRMKAYANV